MLPALAPVACLSSDWQAAPDLLPRLALIGGLVALAGWTSAQRRFPGRGSFHALLWLMVAWLGFTTLGHAAAAPACKATMAVAVWPAILGLTALWALFVVQYAQTTVRLPRRWSLPVLTGWGLLSLAALSNGVHGGLYGPGSGLGPVEAGLVRMRYERGPLFPLLAAWGYGWLAVTLLLLVRAWRQATQADERRQWALFLAAMMLPVAASIAYVGYGWRLFGGDPTPLSFGAALLGFAWLVRRRQLFTAIPLARRLLFEELPDPVLVLDPRGQVRDANRAAERLGGGRPEGSVALADWPRFGAPLAAVLAQTPRPLLELDDPPRVFEVGLREIGAGGTVLGRLLQLRDVTAHHRAQAELEKTLDERNDQLVRVAALQQALHEQARRDPLTGLHNRRALDEQFERGLAPPWALAIVDVDHFKRINDGAGHAAGDRVLQALAAAIQAGLRRADRVFRVGGEEFVVLLPGADLDGAARRMEALREQLASATLDAAVGRVTVSIGVAAAVGADAAPGALYEAADAALYRAKAAGRDRVCRA